MPGHVVAVENHDGKARELQESFHRHFFGFHVSEKVRVFDGNGHFTLGKREAASRFVGDDTFDTIALHADQPVDAAALRMPHKNGISRFFKYGGQSIRVDLRVVWRRIGRHLAEELIQRFRILRECRSVVELRPQSHSKLPEKEAFLGSGGDLSGYRASSGIAATWLIHQIDRHRAGGLTAELKPVPALGSLRSHGRRAASAFQPPDGTDRMSI